MKQEQKDEALSGRKITIRKCELRFGRFVPRGETETLSIELALERFAPTKAMDARMNVLNARPGNYLGKVKVERRGDRCFLFVNNTPTGDIKWLLRKQPEFESMVKEVYRVEDVEIPHSAIDLPPLNMSSGESINGF